MRDEILTTDVSTKGWRDGQIKPNTAPSTGHVGGELQSAIGSSLQKTFSCIFDDPSIKFIVVFLVFTMEQPFSFAAKNQAQHDVLHLFRLSVQVVVPSQLPIL